MGNELFFQTQLKKKKLILQIPGQSDKKGIKATFVDFDIVPFFAKFKQLFVHWKFAGL